MNELEIQEAVRERYAAKAAQLTTKSGCGCGDCDCGKASASIATPDVATAEACCAPSYSAADLASIGLDVTASLGCGNPTLLIDLHPGETVLDLGSGAGIDVLLSARRVAPGGHPYGVGIPDRMGRLPPDNPARAGGLQPAF